MSCRLVIAFNSVCLPEGTIFGKPNSFNPKLNKIMGSEATVFRHHPQATHVRYGTNVGVTSNKPL